MNENLKRYKDCEHNSIEIVTKKGKLRSNE